jgi:hypothetical protein
MQARRCTCSDQSRIIAATGDQIRSDQIGFELNLGSCTTSTQPAIAASDLDELEFLSHLPSVKAGGELDEGVEA